MVINTYETNYSYSFPRHFTALMKTSFFTTLVPCLDSHISNSEVFLNVRIAYIRHLSKIFKTSRSKGTNWQIIPLNLFTWYCAFAAPLNVFTWTRLLLTVYHQMIEYIYWLLFLLFQCNPITLHLSSVYCIGVNSSQLPEFSNK